MSSTIKQIIVIGGGGAGVGTARDLAKKIDPSRAAVTLISARPFYTHMPATPRMVVSAVEDLEERALVPLDRIFTSPSAGKFKLGQVVGITVEGDGKSGTVSLEDGEKLRWDYLVLATGSKWEGALNFPSSKAEMHTHLEGWRAKFKKANHIALVGGGAVGIEIAGELKDAFPQKKITIIHNGKLLLNPTYPDKFRNAAARTALSRGIQLVLEDSVTDIPEDGIVSGIRTAKGVSIPADFVVASRGWTPNTAIFSNIPGLLNERGQVKTLPTFQTTVAPHIFAIGDITDIDEQKQLAKTGGHSATVIANILSLLQGRPAAKNYGGGFEGIALISGRTAGNMYLPFFGGMSFGNWATSNLKGKGLLLPMTRKTLGY